MRKQVSILLALIAVATACTSAQPAGQRSGGSEPAVDGANRQPTVLRLVTRFEIQSFAAKFDEPGGGAGPYAKRPFNAGLAVIDAETRPRPVLAEQLPQLNTPSWQVSPDGRMQTTYTLRPGLTWHDGNPITAEDFVFAWRVYRAPSLPILKKPQDLMDSVT